LAAWRVRDNSAPLFWSPCRFALFCRQSPAIKVHAAWVSPAQRQHSCLGNGHLQ
jgi:hypothetical protein